MFKIEKTHKMIVRIVAIVLAIAATVLIMKDGMGESLEGMLEKAQAGGLTEKLLTGISVPMIAVIVYSVFFVTVVVGGVGFCLRTGRAYVMGETVLVEEQGIIKRLVTALIFMFVFAAAFGLLAEINNTVAVVLAAIIVIDAIVEHVLLIRFIVLGIKEKFA
ncbi:hypothetical protein SAMN04487884_12021 [Butyrivibrio fibrisolvens]|uniref:DUF2975 domain-containing protein n=2 Tax=Butyrivibrio fibrisolvens TaxID=831 RepID=A0A1H9UX03_BUTFI|nr:hypothetical protein SAMN04487884_12021 [Butyrivibrio fibrisolvens]